MTPVRFEPLALQSRVKHSTTDYCAPPGLLIVKSVTKNISYYSTGTYVVGTQKNHLNGMVRLNTQTYVKNNGLENIYNFMMKIFVYLKPVKA